MSSPHPPPALAIKADIRDEHSWSPKHYGTARKRVGQFISNTPKIEYWSPNGETALSAALNSICTKWASLRRQPHFCDSPRLLGLAQCECGSPNIRGQGIGTRSLRSTLPGSSHSALIGHSMRPRYNRPCDFYIVLPGVLLARCLVELRIPSERGHAAGSLVVESLRQLLFLGPAVYHPPSWSNYLPHLS